VRGVQCTERWERGGYLPTSVSVLFFRGLQDRRSETISRSIARSARSARSTCTLALLAQPGPGPKQ